MYEVLIWVLVNSIFPLPMEFKHQVTGLYVGFIAFSLKSSMEWRLLPFSYKKYSKWIKSGIEMCIEKVFQSNLYKLKWEKSNFCKLMYYTLHSWLLCTCRYNSPIIESIIAMILIDILDVTVRYWIDNDCDRDLAEIQIELSTETLKRTEYLTT